MFKLNSQQLRIHKPTREELDVVKQRRRELYLILDDVLDTFNIGAFFRLADAVGVKKMWLCGKSECPPNSRIEKASVGTHRWVDWEYRDSIVALLHTIKAENPGIAIVGVEQSKHSVSLREFDFHLPIVLIVGHESTGISEAALQLCDIVLEIPMYGVNKSVNVLMAAAMVYGALEKNC